MSESKCFKGGLPDSKLFEDLFSLCLEKFSGRKGGGLPYSKTFVELFSLNLDIFQEERGVGLPDSKDDEVLCSALA